ncbi:MAG: AhpC/TSA family protein [Bacteroidota bacterium]|nr:AhpC/TSA family protein [Bacteroidota bacterium]
MKKKIDMRNWLILLLPLAFACDRNEGNTELKGTIENSEEVIISEIHPDRIEDLDTLKISNGDFEYHPTLEGPTFLLLKFLDGPRIPLLVRPGETLQLSLDASQPVAAFNVEGSPGSQRLSELNEEALHTYYLMDSLDRINYMYQDSANFAEIRRGLDEAFKVRIDAHRRFLQNFILEDTTDLASIIAFNHRAGDATLLDPRTDLPFFISAANGMYSAFPDNEHAQSFYQKLNDVRTALMTERERLNIRNQFNRGYSLGEIALPDPNGDTLRLSQLRGKVVLVDFWASWCKPCRLDNPFLVNLYNTYHDRGFEIFSVSLDGTPNQPEPAEDWKRAIETDGLDWPWHVSDLDGWKSLVIPQFGLEAIPYNFLIDEEGHILARNIRGGELKTALDSIMGGRDVK